MSVKGIFFDLDGTLWDSSAEVTASWNEYLEKNTEIDKKITVSQIQSYMGKTLEVISGLCFPNLPKDEQLKVIKMCDTYEIKYLKDHCPKFFDGGKEVLTELSKKYKIAIISNCQEGYIERYLEHCKFADVFCDYESAGATGLSKGKNIRLVMQRQGVDECIYVGDTQGDADAAKEAGIPFVYAEYGFGNPDYYDKSINSIYELPDVIETLFK